MFVRLQLTFHLFQLANSQVIVVVGTAMDVGAFRTEISNVSRLPDAAFLDRGLSGGMIVL